MAWSEPVKSNDLEGRMGMRACHGWVVEISSGRDRMVKGLALGYMASVYGVSVVCVLLALTRMWQG